MTRASRPRLGAALLCGALAVSSAGCASYRGGAQNARAEQVESDPGWIGTSKLRDVRQEGNKDCGAAALSAVLDYWGAGVDAKRIDRELRPGAGRGIRAGDLRDYARKRGLLAFTFYGTMSDLQRELDLGRPVIVGTIKPYSDDRGLQHYEVVVAYHPKKRLVLTMDPAHGFRTNSLDGFLAEWASTNWVTVVVMAPPEAERGQDAEATNGIVIGPSGNTATATSPP